MDNQLPLTKSIFSTVNPNAVMKHEVLHTLFAEAKKERREVELVNMETGERTTNLSVLERAEEYTKGLITLNLTPNVDTIVVIGCATFEALAIFAAAAQVGVGFNQPFLHPPREENIATLLAVLSSKVVIFGEGADGQNASALLSLFDSDTPSPSSSRLPFVEHLFYDSSFKGRSPSHKCVKTLNNLRELGESVTEEKLAEVRNNVKPDFSFLHIFTSGSTGTPKCIYHFQRTMVLVASAERTGRGPTLILNTAMGSLSTYAGLAPALAGNSGTMVMTPEAYEGNPSKDLGKLLTEAIISERIVNLAVAPPILGALVDHMKRNQISLDHPMKSVIHGWQITSKQCLEDGEHLLKGTNIIIYGVSELTAIGASPPGDSEQRKRYNQEGRLYPTSSNVLRIVDEQNQVVDIGEVGEIQAKSATTMKGYRNDEQKTKAFFTQDGFAKTGDAGVMFSDGTFKVLGRTSDEQRFKVYGELEYPGPMEEIMSQHPEISQIYVVSGKLTDWIGEEITACIMTKDRSKRISEEELFDFWESKGMYERQRPARILYFDEFPVTKNVSKISRTKLTKQVRDMIAEDDSLGKCQWFINKENSDKIF